ncbi:MAG: hypothetical protein KGJ62_03245 [Armatimonadetes bacterium]|nr:hypothetical protein [Armatimonadota bacterium]MDE2205751.1 hypothetical protein [Armatimonadota bacterium]
MTTSASALRGRFALVVVFESLQSLGLIVWLGGLAIIGAVVAPAAFSVAGLTPLQAGSVVGESLRSLGGLIEVSGVVMAASQFVLRRRWMQTRSLYIADGFRQLLTLAALMVAEFCRYSLFPALDFARRKNDIPRFEQLHHIYSNMAMVQVVLLLGVLLIAGWLNASRTSASPQSGGPASDGEVAPAGRGGVTAAAPPATSGSRTPKKR